MQSVHSAVGATATCPPLKPGTDPSFGCIPPELMSTTNSRGSWVAASTVPIIALAGIVYVVGKMNATFASNMGEFHRATTRYHRINAAVIVGGFIAVAIVAIKAVALANQGITIGLAFSVIALVMGMATALNDYAYKRSLS